MFYLGDQRTAQLYPPVEPEHHRIWPKTNKKVNSSKNTQTTEMNENGSIVKKSKTQRFSKDKDGIFHKLKIEPYHL